MSATDIPRATPLDAVELALQGIYTEILALDNVPVDVPFLNLGGHSLTALQIQDSILADLGCDVPLEDLFVSGSVREIAVAVRSAAGVASGRCIASLSQASAVTLFCVPGIMGSALEYQVLAEALVPAGVQVRAFQSRGFLPGTGPHRDIRSMAAEYALELHAEGAQRLMLLGNAMGGLVTFEMARALEANGITVEHLFLVEIQVPGTGGDRQVAETRTGVLALQFDDQLRGPDSSPSELEAADLLELAVTRDMIPEGYTVADLMRALEVVRCNVEATAHYRLPAKPLDVTATVLAVPRGGEPFDLGWATALTQEPSVVGLTGPRGRALSFPDVERVAARVVEVATAMARGSGQ